VNAEHSIDLWQQPPTLRGTHVSLEPLRREHADGLRNALARAACGTCGTRACRARDAIEDYIDTALTAQAKGEALVCAVLDAAGAVVGTTRYYQLDRNVPRLAIGYTWYATRVHRTGLNTEAKLLLLAHAFEAMQCAAVGFETSWFNLASRTAIARLGAKQDGVLRNHMRHRDGTLRDTVVFSILANEWPAVKVNLQGKLTRHG
jgi:RimJ/RimL family protein N-acetyltransferase